MSHLIYVNGLGSNYKGDKMYEFIFSETYDVWGEGWDERPANGIPSPPNLQNIKKVGVLKNTQVDLELVQNSLFFSLSDAMEDIICLAYETDESCDENVRLVFKFGEDENSIKDKLYERDLILEFEKETMYG